MGFKYTKGSSIGPKKIQKELSTKLEGALTERGVKVLGGERGGYTD